MKVRPTRAVAKIVECAFCGGILPLQKPRCMITATDGKLLGYFHAGCAEKLVLANKAKGVQPELPGVEVGQIIPKPSEELQ